MELAARVLWRINWIHPFMQGNGRTARMLSYFVLCQKFNMWLPGSPTLPHRIKDTRDEYCAILRRVDDTAAANGGEPDVTELSAYMSRLLKEQIA